MALILVRAPGGQKKRAAWLRGPSGWSLVNGYSSVPAVLDGPPWLKRSHFHRLQALAALLHREFDALTFLQRPEPG